MPSEQRAFAGLLPLQDLSWRLPWADIVVCSDASEAGFCFAVRSCDRRMTHFTVLTHVFCRVSPPLCVTHIQMRMVRSSRQMTSSANLRMVPRVMTRDDLVKCRPPLVLPLTVPLHAAIMLIPFDISAKTEIRGHMLTRVFAHRSMVPQTTRRLTHKPPILPSKTLVLDPSREPVLLWRV